MPIERVRPGDLITADLINRIIDAINQLEKTVASCERKQRVMRKRKPQPKRKKSRG